MASRRPLIVNSSAGQIQELTDSDDLSLPNSNVTAQSFIGDGSSLTGVFPIGGIIMWSGSVASIPSGWSLCDGTNSTPDLRNRFVVGASSGTGDTTYPGLSVDATGGSADAVVVSHSHGITQTDHNHSIGGNVGSGGNNVAFGSGYAADGGDTSGAQANITINSEGVSGTNQNLPPYYALAFIMRTS
jgi:microcystin-dependent protein